jgi:hypothetical protein
MPRRKKRNYKTAKTMALIIFIGFIGVIAFYAVKNNSGKEKNTEEANEKNTEEIAEEDNKNSGEILASDKETQKDDKNSNEKTDKEESSNNNSNENGNDDENTYKTILAGQSLSFEYPDTWQANDLEETNKFSFGPKGKAIAAEYQGDIIIAYKENEKEIPIERYYDGLNDINLFEDASGGFKQEQTEKYIFYTFKDVIGYTSSTVGIFVLSNSFVEMTDVYNKHQEDGVFDQLIQSFKAE